MTKKIKLLFATGNENKVKEVRQLAGKNFEIFSLKDLGLDKFNVEENGTTFNENASIKAKFYSKHTDLPVVADDSGLVIDYLNGEPGIYSARYLGEALSFNDKCKIILEKMENVTNPRERSARFVCVACVSLNEKILFCEEGRVDGYISFEMKGEGGFGYDPIFFYPPLNMTFAEMPMNLKNKISHRYQAFYKLFNTLKNSPKVGEFL
ncbi:dITP/XTP pyrophosphatase [Thermotomaculum hydrothermale]|uniref:dITP/XTP pyrophosphatase n=1 Tax=Thermotomaculum hydrothermale TaxID=981385 RepID=A0A7R6PZC1_9BACT|nr:RdgB/HAM1 family non-canonical purine NTP pyrophosphatase [Thermotomaculum hydrothermale]BBB32488.1 dITP/XTP pyrophosphatase [Thermotomaculum hydrothermale]